MTFWPALGEGLGAAVGSNLLGGLFGGGGSNAGYGLSNSTGSSMGVSGGSSASSSRSVQNPDFVQPDQLQYLQQLWGAGAGLMGAGQESAQGLYDQAAAGLGNIMNPGSNPMLQTYAEDLGRLLNEELMPTIRRDAAGAGMLGGGRQGIAEGQAVAESQRNLQNFASQQYQADMDRLLAGVGMSSQLGQFGMGIPWFGLNQMQGLLGPAITLGGGGMSESQSTGSNFGHQMSENMSSSATGPKRGFVEGHMGGGPSFNTPRTGGGGFTSGSRYGNK